MTPQQHKQHLLELAERCKEIIEWQDTGKLRGDALRKFANTLPELSTDNLMLAESKIAREAMEAVVDFAARLTPGVSDAMVEIASKAACKADDEDGLRWPDQIIRKALEAVFPLVDDGQAKDAARYRWLLDWYLRAGKRAEIDPLGHIRVTTSEIVSAAIDAAMKEQRG